MRPRLKISVGDWPEAVCLVAFLVLSFFVVPLAPFFVRVAFGLLIAASAFWAAASALRERWRESKTSGAFIGYYARLVGIGFGIVAGWALLMLLLAKFVIR